MTYVKVPKATEISYELVLRRAGPLVDGRQGMESTKQAENEMLVASSLRVDPREQRAWLDGSLISIQAKAFRLLIVLMRRPQSLWTKDELIEEVWDGRFVSEAVLTTTVRELRRALNDKARSPTYVETVHGQGYRFLLHVEAKDSLEEQGRGETISQDSSAVASRSPKSEKRSSSSVVRLVVACMIVTALAGLCWFAWDLFGENQSPRAPSNGRVSVAVLPFEYLSEGGERGWLAAGLTEEVSASLGRVPDIHLASDTVVAELSDNPARADTIAARKGVDYILSGTVRSDGGRVRVTAEVSNSADGRVIWSDIFDQTPDDVIGLQQDMARAIVRSLDLVTDPARLQQMLDVGTKSVPAYEAFLRAIALDAEQDRRADPTVFDATILEFDRARKIDPGFARAHWEYAQQLDRLEVSVDVFSGEIEMSEEERQDAVREATEMAIETTRDPIEQLAYRSALARQQFDFLSAQSLMQEFVDQRPNNVQDWILLAEYASLNSDAQTTLEAAETAYRVARDNGESYSFPLTVLGLALQFDDLEGRLDSLLADYPNVAIYRYQAHRGYLWAGADAKARALLPSIQGSSLRPHSQLLAQLRQACAEGRVADSRELLDQINALEFDRVSLWLAYQIAGQQSHAKALLEPLDTQSKHQVLATYMAYPFFEPRDYPLFFERLAATSGQPRRAVEVPRGCTISD